MIEVRCLAVVRPVNDVANPQWLLMRHTLNLLGLDQHPQGQISGPPATEVRSTR